jgi:phosphatidylserine/phosphatidylglycerophosphate/cardiolipin synthase-like enzyme
MSQYETNDKLELIQETGVDLLCVRIQAKVHNKGIIVDSKVAAVGSQNWSGDGILRNRDATLIVYNEEAAQYWEEIFIQSGTIA